MLCKWGAEIITPKLKKLGIQLCKVEATYEGYCDEHVPHTLKMKRDYDACTQEQRQEYLDLINSGSTIGDAYRTVGISFEAALEITNRAIGTYHYLKKEA